MKSHMGFPLTPRSMTLDDLELHKFEFLVNFAGFRRFRTQQQLNTWRYASIVSDNVVSTSNWSNFWQTFTSRGFVSDSWAFLFYYNVVQRRILTIYICIFIFFSLRFVNVLYTNIWIWLWKTVLWQAEIYDSLKLPCSGPSLTGNLCQTATAVQTVTNGDV